MLRASGSRLIRADLAEFGRFALVTLLEPTRSLQAGRFCRFRLQCSQFAKEGSLYSTVYLSFAEGTLPQKIDFYTWDLTFAGDVHSVRVLMQLFTIFRLRSEPVSTRN